MKKLLFALLILVSISCKQKQKESQLVKLSGPVFGTGFNIQYADNENADYSKEIDSLFNDINKSLSTYIPDSDISKLNRNEISEVDHYFVEVFNTSKSNNCKLA